ncbi:hypothetical protein M0802_000060 [Mischocyttarus mexicanus]|nr:hypothetical protein M0802_000060 [Mischocyttarus mexicanus]
MVLAKSLKNSRQNALGEVDEKKEKEKEEEEDEKLWLRTVLVKKERKKRRKEGSKEVRKGFCRRDLPQLIPERRARCSSSATSILANLLLGTQTTSSLDRNAPWKLSKGLPAYRQVYPSG